MWFTSRSHNRQSAIFGECRRADGFRRHRLAFRPRSELLEGRALLSTLTVTNTLDSGHGSLRYEIAHANKNTTIDFAPSLSGQTITLTSGELDITTGLTIQGRGAGQLSISGGKNSRVFDVNASAPVVLSGLTISNGVAFGSSTALYEGDGGGILNLSTLTLSGCIVSGNSGESAAPSEGGGIYNAGTLTLTGCTVSSNYANPDFSYALGGGIYNAGTLTVINSTFSGNHAESEGGGIFNVGTLTVSNSTLSGNDAYGNGGGICNAGTLTVSNSTFNSNWIYLNGTFIENDIYGPYTDGGGNTFS
jgi:hypothetical protein